MNLQTLQLSFKNAVAQPRYLSTDPTPELEASIASFRAEVKDDHGISPDERIEIYAYAYSARILESLEDDFAGTKALIDRMEGEDSFREILERFLSEYPSRSTSLVDVGRAFPQFLKGQPEARKYPFLYDLAQLDWAKVVAFFGPIAPAYAEKPFDFAELNQLPPESWPEVRLVLNPALVLLELDHAVHEFEAKRARPRVDARKTFLRAHRAGSKVEVVELAPYQFRTLSLISKGLKLGQIAEAFTAEFERGETVPFMEWFLLWARDGVIIAAEASART